MYRRLIKPLIDITAAFIGSIVLLPLFILLVIAIKLDSRGPMLFKQKRVGKNKKLFNIYKFRTMRTDTPHDMPTHLLEDPDRYITRVGRFLRKTSLDELPQIFNILSGQMSIVGPRPALWNQDDLIAERDKYGANALKPGLTGWAQVNGRNAISWTEKFKLDVWYVDHVSLVTDLKVIFITVKKVLMRSDISQEGSATMPKFDGTN